MFLKNAWYVAAWSEEVVPALKQVRILNQRICLFRDTKGRVVAMEDACPHRKLPLSKGRLKGDRVECGYHGLTFDCAGHCVWAPGAGEIPSDISLRTYPIAERYGLVWIWMGNPTIADTDDIFDVPQFDDPDWGISRGSAMDLDCNYLYMTDNLLDPTHVAWVHESSFAEEATRDTPLRVTRKEDGIIVHRWMKDVEPAPFYKEIVAFEGRCDRLQHYEVRYPSHALIRAVFTPAGHGGEAALDHPQTFIMDSYNFMTPVSERQTRYFWFQLRNLHPKDAKLSAKMAEGVRKAFEEDRLVLNEVQIGMEEAMSPAIDLPIDAGPLRFRRQLQALIHQEAEIDKQMPGAT